MRSSLIQSHLLVLKGTYSNSHALVSIGFNRTYWY